MKTIKPAIVMAMMIPFLSTAQQFTNIGTVELGGEISYSSQSTQGDLESQKVFAFAPYFGYMVARGFELGFMPQIASSDDNDVLSFYFAPTYNFNTKTNIYPYLEFIGGYSSLTNDGTVFSGYGVGGSGGLKINIGASGMLVVGLQFINQTYALSSSSSPSYSINTPTQSTTINTMLFQFGYTVFLNHFEKEKTTDSK